MVNLSGAHLMDGQHVLSQEHLRVAEEIAHRYNNLRLIWIPVSDRIPGTDDKPFGIMDIQTRIIVKTVPEHQVHMLPAWLYQNDSQRVDTYAAFEREQAAAKAARKQEHEERVGPQIELASAILKSPKHSFQHDGKRYSDGGIELVN